MKSLLADIERIPENWLYGRVTAVMGMLIEIGGAERRLSIGDRCIMHGRADEKVTCEVIGFRNGRALLMPFSALEGVGIGCKVEVTNAEPVIYPDPSWLGRVVNAMGQPIDGKGPLVGGNVGYRLRSTPPPANRRQRVAGKINLGVRAINTFLTCCRGQRRSEDVV